MFIPLHDDTPHRVIRFQWVTLVIMVLNVGIFLYSGGYRGEAFLASTLNGFGLVPAALIKVLHGQEVISTLPEPMRLITYQFIHSGWLHLIGNMLFLWVFADNVEDAYGPFAFLLFYLLCGIAGGLAHVVLMPHSDLPLIGASGSVSGILAAYVYLFPRARVWVLLFMRIPVPLPALWVLGSWFVLQLLGVVLAVPGQEVAYGSHLGGFATGLILTFLLRNFMFGSRGGI